MAEELGGLQISIGLDTSAIDSGIKGLGSKFANSGFSIPVGLDDKNFDRQFKQWEQQLRSKDLGVKVNVEFDRASLSNQIYKSIGDGIEKGERQFGKSIEKSISSAFNDLGRGNLFGFVTKGLVAATASVGGLIAAPLVTSFKGIFKTLSGAITNEGKFSVGVDAKSAYVEIDKLNNRIKQQSNKIPVTVVIDKYKSDDICKEIATLCTEKTVRLRVDRSELNGIQGELDNLGSNVVVRKSITTEQVVKVQSDNQGLTGIGDRISESFSKSTETLSKNLGGAFQRAIPKQGIFGTLLQGIFGTVLAPLSGAFTGIFEGIGSPLGKRIGAGLSRELETALSPMIGSFELVGKRLAVVSSADSSQGLLGQIAPSVAYIVGQGDVAFEKAYLDRENKKVTESKRSATKGTLTEQFISNLGTEADTFTQIMEAKTKLTSGSKRIQENREQIKLLEEAHIKKLESVSSESEKESLQKNFIASKAAIEKQIEEVASSVKEAAKIVDQLEVSFNTAAKGLVVAGVEGADEFAVISEASDAYRTRVEDLLKGRQEKVEEIEKEISKFDKEIQEQLAKAQQAIAQGDDPGAMQAIKAKKKAEILRADNLAKLEPAKEKVQFTKQRLDTFYQGEASEVYKEARRKLLNAVLPNKPQEEIQNIINEADRKQLKLLLERKRVSTSEQIESIKENAEVAKKELSEIEANQEAITKGTIKSDTDPEYLKISVDRVKAKLAEYENNIKSLEDDLQNSELEINTKISEIVDSEVPEAIPVQSRSIQRSRVASQPRKQQNPPVKQEDIVKAALPPKLEIPSTYRFLLNEVKKYSGAGIPKDKIPQLIASSELDKLNANAAYQGDTNQIHLSSKVYEAIQKGEILDPESVQSVIHELRHAFQKAFGEVKAGEFGVDLIRATEEEIKKYTGGIEASVRGAESQGATNLDYVKKAETDAYVFAGRYLEKVYKAYLEQLEQRSQVEIEAPSVNIEPVQALVETVFSSTNTSEINSKAKEAIKESAQSANNAIIEAVSDQVEQIQEQVSIAVSSNESKVQDPRIVDLKKRLETNPNLNASALSHIAVNLGLATSGSKKVLIERLLKKADIDKLDFAVPTFQATPEIQEVAKELVKLPVEEATAYIQELYHQLKADLATELSNENASAVTSVLSDIQETQVLLYAILAENNEELLGSLTATIANLTKIRQKGHRQQLDLQHKLSQKQGNNQATSTPSVQRVVVTGGPMKGGAPLSSFGLTNSYSNELKNQPQKANDLVDRVQTLLPALKISFDINLENELSSLSQKISNREPIGSLKVTFNIDLDFELNSLQQKLLNEKPLKSPTVKLNIDSEEQQEVSSAIDLGSILAAQVAKLSNVQLSPQDIPTVQGAKGAYKAQMQASGTVGLYRPVDNQVILRPDMAQSLSKGDLSKIPYEAIGLIAHELRHAMQLSFGRLSESDLVKGLTGVDLLAPLEHEFEQISGAVEKSVQHAKRSGSTLPEEIIRQVETDAYVFELRYGSLIHEAIQEMGSDINVAIEKSKITDLSDADFAKEIDRINEAITDSIQQKILDSVNGISLGSTGALGKGKKTLKELEEEVSKQSQKAKQRPDPKIATLQEEQAKAYAMGTNAVNSANKKFNKFNKTNNDVNKLEELQKEINEQSQNNNQQFNPKVVAILKRRAKIFTSGANAVDSAERNLNKFERAENSINQRYELSSSQVGTQESLIQRLGKSFNGLGSNIFNVVKGLLAFQGITWVHNWFKTVEDRILAVTRRFQVLERTIEFISGSPTTGAETIKFLNSEVDRTGGNLQASFEGFKTIAASSRGTKMEGEQTRQIFSAVTQAASVYGLDEEQTKGSLLAISQMISKGCYDAETEVLTSEGWIKWEDATETHFFATLDLSTKEVSYQRPNRMIRYTHTGLMCRIEGEGVDLLVTPDHRLVVKEEGETEYKILKANELRPINYYFLIGAQGEEVLVSPGNIAWQNDFRGEVFCSEVPNTTLFVKRNNKLCWSGNSISSEELRGQLSERIPGALQIMARSLNVTEKELGGLLESGSLVASEVLPKFATQMAMETAGGVAGASKTAQGSINKLNNEIQRLQIETGKKILPIQVVGLNAITELLKALTPYVGTVITGLTALSVVVGVTLTKSFFSAGSGSELLGKALKFLGIQSGLTAASLLKSFAVMAAQAAAIVIAIESLKIAWEMYNVAVGNNDLSEWANTSIANINKVKAAWEEYKNRDKKKPAPEAEEFTPPSVGGWDSAIQGFMQNSYKVLPNYWMGNEESKKKMEAQAQKAYQDLKKANAPGFVSYSDLNAQNRRIQYADRSVGMNVLADSAAKIGLQFKGGLKNIGLDEAIKQFKEGKLEAAGLVGEVTALDKEIEQLQIQKMALPKSASKEEGDTLQKQIDEKLKARQEKLKPIVETQAAIDQDIRALEAKVKEEADPQIRQGMQADVDQLKKFKEQLGKVTTATSAVDEIKRFAHAMREIAVGIAEASREAANWLTVQNKLTTEKAIAAFSGDEFGSRTLAREKLQNQRQALEKEIAGQRKAIDTLDKEMSGGRNAAILKGAGIDENTSIDRMRRIAEETTDGSAKKAIEAAAQAKESKEKLAQNEGNLAETNLQIRQQAEQDALHIIQVSAAKAELATRQSENARVSVVKSKAKDRKLTEEQVAEELARISRDTAKENLISLEQQMAALNQKQKDGTIGAEQYLERERDLQGRISDQKKAIAESELGVQEAVNRRKLTDSEFMLKQQEAQVEASQTAQINAVKRRQASGKLSERQAQAEISQIQMAAIDKQIAQERKRMAETDRLVSEKAISSREGVERNTQSRQKISQLEGQKQDTKQQQNQQALQSLELANRKAEQTIDISQQTRINAIKEQQSVGILSERQAQEQINRIQKSAIASQVAETKKQIEAIRALKKSGRMSAEDAMLKELELNQKLGQLNNQRIDNEIQKNQQLIQSLELVNRKREMTLELAQSDRVSDIKKRQASGDLSDRQAQIETTNSQKKYIADQIALAQKQLKDYDSPALKKAMSAEDRDMKKGELKNKISQLRGQQSDAVLQSNQQALQALELANRKAEQTIEVSQTKRINAIKEKQAIGVLSERQAQEQINGIQSSAIASQIAETKKQIEGIRALRKSGKMSAEDATLKELELNQKLGQLNGQRIDNEIQKNQQLIQSLELVARKREMALELKNAEAIGGIKQQQASGNLSDRQAQTQLTDAQKKYLSEQASNVRREMTDNDRLEKGGDRSKEDAEIKRTELKQKLTQINNQLADTEIQKNQQLAQSLELVTRQWEMALDLANTQEINKIKGKQSTGELSDRQAQVELTKNQGEYLTEQASNVRREMGDNDRLEKGGDRSKEDAAMKRAELRQKLEQINGQIVDNRIQAIQQEVQALELGNQRAEKSVELSQQKQINSIKQRQADAEVSELETQSTITKIQADTIDNQIANVEKEIRQNITLKEQGKRSNEEYLTKELDLKQKLTQLTGQKIDNEMQGLQQLRQSLQQVIDLREAELSLQTAQRQAGTAKREADSAEILGTISPMRRLQLDRENLLTEQSDILGRGQNLHDRLGNLSKMKYDAKTEQMERLKIQTELAQNEAKFQGNRKSLAENKYQLDEKTIEAGIAIGDLDSSKGMTAIEKQRLDNLKKGLSGADQMLQFEASANKLAAEKESLLRRQTDAQKRMNLLPTGDERRFEMLKQLDELQREIYRNEADSIELNNKKYVTGMDRRLKQKEAELSLAMAQNKVERAKKEAELAEASGGTVGALDKLSFDRGGLQDEQRLLMAQLDMNRSKASTVTKRGLDPAEAVSMAADLERERKEIQEKLYGNRKALAENQAGIREKKDELTLSQLGLQAAERELELQQQELALLRSGMPFRQERVALQMEEAKVATERESLFKKQESAQNWLGENPGAAEEERIKRQATLVDINRFLSENEKKAIEVKRKLEADLIDQRIAEEKRRHELIMSNLDAEKNAIDSASKQLDLRGKLVGSKQNLSKALSDAAQAQGQIELEGVGKKLDAKKRLENEEDLDPNVRKALQNIAGNQSERELLDEKFRLENQIADRKMAALKAEHEFAQANLEIDLRRAELAAYRASLDAQGEQLNAQRKIEEAEATTKKAENSRDSEAIANANNELSLARKQKDIADEKVSLAQMEVQMQGELASDARRAMAAQQGSAIAQENSANSARKQTQELERAEVLANKKASSGKSSGGGGGGGSFTLVGDSIADYRSATERLLQDLKSLGGQENVLKTLMANNSKFYAMAAQNQGFGELVQLADSLKQSFSQQEIAKVSSDASISGRDVIAELKALNQNIDRLASRPSIGSLSVSSPNPVGDSGKIISDMSRNSLRNS